MLAARVVLLSRRMEKNPPTQTGRARALRSPRSHLTAMRIARTQVVHAAIECTIAMLERYPGAFEHLLERLLPQVDEYAAWKGVEIRVSGGDSSSAARW